MAHYTEHDHRHLAGTTTAADVDTPLVKQVRASVATLQDKKGVVVIDGPNGVGKTFSVSRAAESGDLPCYWLDLTGETSISIMYAKLYKAITGEFPGPMKQYVLGQEIQNLLSAGEAMLVIDEAQWAPTRLLRAARSTFDQTAGPFVLVLLGHGLTHKIAAREPGLDSRTSRRITATALTAKGLTTALGAYHPIFENSEPTVIASIDKWARGNWRRWAQTLEVALTLSLHGGITKADLKHIAGLLGQTDSKGFAA